LAFFLEALLGKRPAADPYTPFLSVIDRNGPELIWLCKPEFVKTKNAFRFTDTTYGVPGCNCNGEARLCCCQPDAVSPENGTLANTVPALLHTLPVCVPVSNPSLKNRIAVNRVGSSTVTRTPNS
jgi:hypothetical protein